MAESAAGAGGGDVRLAFVLGWHVAELFHARVPQRPAAPAAAEAGKLPGLGELGDHLRALLLVDQIKAELLRAGPWLEQAGQAIPDLLATERLLRGDPIEPAELRSAVALLHRDLLLGLTAADFRLGKAYGLGRALLETCRRANARERASLEEAFDEYRLATLSAWLLDLKSVFPEYAANAVRGSLQAWSEWLRAPVVEVRAARSDRLLGTDPVDWESAADRERVTRALHRQGEVWRGLLSGEKRAVDLLSADDYVSAAEELLGHLRHLAMRFVRRYWAALAIAAAVLAAIVVGLVAVNATAKVVALLGAGGAALGVSLTGVSASLGRTIRQVQAPLWATVLQSGIARAATLAPVRLQPDR